MSVLRPARVTLRGSGGGGGRGGGGGGADETAAPGDRDVTSLADDIFSEDDLSPAATEVMLKAPTLCLGCHRPAGEKTRHWLDPDTEKGGASGRGLHSSTFRLNVSAFCGIGSA
jgi:hypothetical protein